MDMKIILIVLLLFKISSRASAEKNPNNCVYNRPPLISFQPSTSTAYYCQNFKYHKVYNVSQDETDPNITYKQEWYDKCVETIKPYFKKVDENEKSIDKFHKFCEDDKIDASYCGKIMKHLKIWCFDMESAVDLLRVVDKKRYIDTENGYKEITILYEDWNEFKNIGNVNIQNCLPKFKEQTSKSSRFVMRMFKQWFDMDNNKASRCNCIEIFGIYDIYKAKEENLEKAEGNSMLQKYFKTFCLPTKENDIEKLHVWSSMQFQEIADTAENIKLEHIRSFLFEGTKIAEANWFNAGVSPRRWPFDYMIKEIKFDEENYESRIILISVVLNCMMTTADYENFRDRVLSDKDCVSLGCWIRKFEVFRQYYSTSKGKLVQSYLEICMEGIQQFRNNNEMYLPN